MKSKVLNQPIPNPRGIVEVAANPRRRKAKRRKRRTYRAAAAPAPRRRRRSTYKPARRRRAYRNPAKGLLPFSMVELAGAGIGSIAARQIPDLILKSKNQGPVGWAANLAVAIGLPMLMKQTRQTRGLAKAAGLGAGAFLFARIAGETAFKKLGLSGVVDLGSDMAYLPVEFDESGYGDAGAMVEGPTLVDASEVGLSDEFSDYSDDLGDLGDGDTWSM